MLDHRTLVSVSVLGLATGWVSAAGPQITSAERALTVWAAGYDYEFDDIAGENDATTATDGAFDRGFTIDLLDYYGYFVATGSGSIKSNLACDAATVSLDVLGSVVGAQIFQSDGGAEGTATITFTIEQPTRVALDADLVADTGYVIGHVFLRDATSATLASAVVQGPGADSESFETVLPPESYTLDVELLAWAYQQSGPAPATDIAMGTLTAELRLHALADLDRSGDVGFSDIVQMLADWGPCADPDECESDLDGTEDVGFGDLTAVLQAWGSCGD